MSGNKETAIEWVERNSETIIEFAQGQWRNPQLPMQEEYALSVLTDWLESNGFEVRSNVSGMPTAFVAECVVGDGSPTVGFIAEYDALAGLSNEVTTFREPLEEEGPGHGCGHNLIGTGNTAAAIAVKEALLEADGDGTVRVYGSPAEELLVSNVFMARDGLFDGDDFILTSHPQGQQPSATTRSSLALISSEFEFHGQSCHMPSAPQEGKNALDAAIQLINGANQLKKHMDPETTIEYVITEGGSQPNVVPAVSKVWFFIRHPDVEMARRGYEKVRTAAEGAATATDTTLDENFITGCYPYLMNEIIAETIYENAVEIGAPSYTEDERAFAQELIDSYDIDAQEPISEEVTLERGETYLASQDDGDTSWLVPMGRFHFPYPNELPLHTWAATATSGSSIGFRGMLYSAKTLACTALEIISDSELLDEITNKFEAVTSEFEYECLVPADVDPISAEWVEARLGD